MPFPPFVGDGFVLLSCCILFYSCILHEGPAGGTRSCTHTHTRTLHTLTLFPQTHTHAHTHTHTHTHTQTCGRCLQRVRALSRRSRSHRATGPHRCTAYPTCSRSHLQPIVPLAADRTCSRPHLQPIALAADRTHGPTQAQSSAKITFRLRLPPHNKEVTANQRTQQSSVCRSVPLEWRWSGAGAAH